MLVERLDNLLSARGIEAGCRMAGEVWYWLAEQRVGALAPLRISRRLATMRALIALPGQKPNAWRCTANSRCQSPPMFWLFSVGTCAGRADDRSGLIALQINVDCGRRCGERDGRGRTPSHIRGA